MQWGRCKKRIFLSQWANGPIQIVCKMKPHGQKILYDLSTIVTLFLTENSSTYALMIENTFRIEEGIVKDCRIRHMSVKKSFSKLGKLAALRASQLACPLRWGLQLFSMIL